LDFPRRFSAFHFAISCGRWLQTLVNRIDRVLFDGRSESWIAALSPDRHDLIAIDGKASQRTQDTRKALKARDTLSAYLRVARELLETDVANYFGSAPRLVCYAQDYSLLLATFDRSQSIAAPAVEIFGQRDRRNNRGRMIMIVLLGFEQASYAETRRTAPLFEEGAGTLHLFKYSSSEALIPIHKPQNSHMEFQ